MTEQIKYAFGSSSLGVFVVATSGKGLVAFEFSDRKDEAIAVVKQRVPEADLVEDAAALEPTLQKLSCLVDHPAEDPDIALDPRGSDYERTVWTMLREIPAGETTSYGALAAKLGTRDARDVTAAIAANGIAILIPCHRVVKKDGSLSGYRWGFARKRTLLSRERDAAPFRLL